MGGERDDEKAFLSRKEEAGTRALLTLGRVEGGGKKEKNGDKAWTGDDEGKMERAEKGGEGDSQNMGDISGTTAAVARKMTPEEREIVLYKRKLRNRESARKSRERRKATQLYVRDGSCRRDDPGNKLVPDHKDESLSLMRMQGGPHPGRPSDEAPKGLGAGKSAVKAPGDATQNDKDSGSSQRHHDEAQDQEEGEEEGPAQGARGSEVDELEEARDPRLRRPPRPPRAERAEGLQGSENVDAPQESRDPPEPHHKRHEEPKHYQTGHDHRNGVDNIDMVTVIAEVNVELASIQHSCGQIMSKLHLLQMYHAKLREEEE